MSEYKPEPVLAQREKGFVECIKDGYIARDEDGELFWGDQKPYKEKASWDMGFNADVAEINRETFPFIKWEDEEPWAVEDLRKLKVEGGVADD